MGCFIFFGFTTLRIPHDLTSTKGYIGGIRGPFVRFMWPRRPLTQFNFKFRKQEISKAPFRLPIASIKFEVLVFGKSTAKI